MMRLLSDAALEKLIDEYEREEGARRESGLSALGGGFFKSLFKSAASAAVGFVSTGFNPAGAVAGAVQGFAQSKADEAMKKAQRAADEHAAAAERLSGDALTRYGVDMRNPKARAINQQMVARARIAKAKRDKLIKYGLFAAIGVGALIILIRSK
jgi:hypothetical protein